MIRVLLREALVLFALLFAVSVGAFVALDATGQHDWWGTLDAARRAGVPESDALARDLPRLWNPRVRDAQERTLEDLAQLGDEVTRDAARARLLQRGTAALPTLLAQLETLPRATQIPTLDVLATMAPALTGGEHPPHDPTEAVAYWQRFYTLRGLDFRAIYARRLVQRLVDHESRNAEEQLMRLGTFALPAVFDVLDGSIDSDGARRLSKVLSDMTGLALRVGPDATVAETQRVVESWRAWWFAERLEYEQLTDLARVLGHVTETRYGRWFTRAVSGRLGTSAVTHRPILAELRERAPRSLFVGGLGGLLATALVVAFGGGTILRRRPLGTKLLDLTGALVPGLAAFLVAFIALTQLCAAPWPLAPHLRLVLSEWPQLAVAVALLTPLASLYLRRRSARVVLHAVRHEAESWALESRHPRLIQVLRHGARVGVASLLAPLSLSALPLIAFSLIVEPIVRMHGMAALTVQSFRGLDAPWLLIAVLTVVPVYVARRWTHRALLWALGDPASRPAPPMTLMPPAPTAPRAPRASEDVYDAVLESGALRTKAPRVPTIEGIDTSEAE